jgi:hypothetical protein
VSRGASSLIDQPLGVARRPLDQRSDLLRRLAEAREDVVGDDVGIGRVRATDSGPHAPEVDAAEAVAKALQAVMAGDPTTELHTHLSERQVDLVVQHHDPLQRHFQGAPSGPGGGT